ncbi:MAG: Glu/Leu/Phe/Val dehydrogenase [Gemmatimonadetes bacterium]|nr:leucine dehydrogenase [Gemmatimonadota bacterium]NNF12551.1 Glu/Leu/Phe/Val dehydrogenase [Gemmatimonadota bacterium]
MEIFGLMSEGGHEQLAFWNDPDLGYRGIIAIHDTTMGPALGGTRFWNYDSDEDAIVDALRLSRGMTYKAAITGLNLGGGKSVIWGDNRTIDREMVFRAHGRAVDSLGGRYITAEDVGTSPDDMEFVSMETEHVVGLIGRSGDPSPVTAYGVYRGIKASAKARYGTDSLAGKHVVVQGVGHVGYYLCEDLAAENAQLTVTDIDQDRIQRVVDDFGADAVAPDEIYDVDADIFAPCALGAVVNDDTIDRFTFDIIAGAANNQLAKGSVHGPALKKRGILYAPDYVINAGGLINVYGEINEWSAERSKRKAGDIYNTLLRIFELAESEDISTHVAANRQAERRIQEARHLQRTW